MSGDALVPAFESPGGDPNADRLLLVSDQFPPAQSAGALRWQKLSRFAAEHGWALDVITRDPAFVDGRDDARLAELPPGTRVFGFAPRDIWLDRVEHQLYGAYRAVGSARTTHAPRTPRDARETTTHTRTPPSVAPDQIRWQPGLPRFWARSYWALIDHLRQLAWARTIETIGRRVLDRDVHRAVISCGPWHLCNHEAARHLARRARLPYIMDLRDPWSLERRVGETIASPVWFALARHYESRCVREAALVVVNAEPVRRAMAAKYPESAERILTITNGYDEEPIPASRQGGRFTVVYAGGIYLDRDPRPFFQAAARTIAALRLTPDDFLIELIGKVDDYGGVPIARMADQEGIAPFVRTGPPRPRRDVLRALANATMLLSLPQDSPWAIPSKIFEYMQFDAWLFVMAEADAPAALLLRDTDADVVPPTDVDGMAAALRRRYEQFARGERPARLAREARFSRRYQAERLMDAIGACLTPRSAAVAPGSPARARLASVAAGESR